MARNFAIAVLAMLGLASTVMAAGNPHCDIYYLARYEAIKFEQWDLVNAINGQIKQMKCCTKDNTKPDCNPTGTVCGTDFKDYASECAACAVGVRFPGSCSPPLDIIDCYNIPMTSQTALLQRVQCFTLALGTIVNAVNLSILLPDPTLPDPLIAASGALSLPCTGDRLRFRTVDGTCNSPVLVYSGMVGLKFTRHDHGYNIPADIDAAIANGPNPRLVSNLLFRRDTFKPNRANLNGLAFAWLNFFIHDFFLHDSDYQEAIAIPLPRDDPDFPAPNAFTEYYMYVPRSTVAADSTDSAQFLRNRATAWFDASQVYSSDAATLASLRSNVGGKLAMNGGLAKDRLLNLSRHDRRGSAPPLFLFGDIRANQHIGLSAITTTFMLEHNNVCTQLAAAYPTLTDAELFGFARNIVAATMWKIQTVEISVQLVDDPAQQAIIASVFTSAPTRAYNPLATHLTPEDFISAYRWHAMVPATLQLRNNARAPIGQPFDYLSTFHDTSILRANGLGPVIVGLGMTQAGWVTLNNHPDAIRRISHPNLVYSRHNPFDEGECEVVPLYDLGAVDIVRERERGLPKIGQYWRNIGLGQYAPTQWMHIAETPSQAQLLGELYDWNIENVDFIVGMLGQDSLPIDGLPQVSEAGFIPFVISRAYSDRFFTAAGFTPDSYTAWGLQRIFGNGQPGSVGVSLAQIFIENGIVAPTTIPTPSKIFKVWA